MTLWRYFRPNLIQVKIKTYKRSKKSVFFIIHKSIFTLILDQKSVYKSVDPRCSVVYNGGNKEKGGEKW